MSMSLIVIDLITIKDIDMYENANNIFVSVQGIQK